MTKYKFTQGFKQLTYRIVETLFDEGMVYGSDLEDFIKTTVAHTTYEFIDDGHYLAFENMVYDVIEKKSIKFEVFDLKTKSSKKYNTIKDIQQKYGYTFKKVKSSLESNIFLDNRYKVNKVRCYDNTQVVEVV